MKKQNLWLATHNQSKIKEFDDLFKNTHFVLKDMKSFPKGCKPPEETGSTFLENALIKFNYFRKFISSEWILTEDSGIEIDALDGRPGIYSARYKGENATWIERLNSLLKELEPVGQSLRTAKMTSVIVLGLPKKNIQIEVEGVIQGTIATRIQGVAGLAYDFVFIPNGQTQTIAELGVQYKNQYSHRAKAVLELKKHLQTLDPDILQS